MSLSSDFDHTPCVKLSENTGAMNLNTGEWIHFLKYQGIITNYLYITKAADPIHTQFLLSSFQAQV